MIGLVYISESLFVVMGDKVYGCFSKEYIQDPSPSFNVFIVALEEE